MGFHSRRNWQGACRQARKNADYFGLPYVVFTDTNGNIRVEKERVAPKNSSGPLEVFYPTLTDGEIVAPSNPEVTYDYHEFAAFWGCDSSYDRWPNWPGDGGLFYNFSNGEFDGHRGLLIRFSKAVERTMLHLQPHTSEWEELAQLRELVLRDALLARVGQERKERTCKD
jgi:hypothetical protein